MMPSYVTTGYVTLAVSFSLSMAVLVSHCCYNKSTGRSFKPQRYTFSHFCMPESYINLFGWQSRLADLDTVLKSAFSCSFRLLATLSSFCCQGSVHVLLLPKQGGPILEFSGVSFWLLILKTITTDEILIYVSDPSSAFPLYFHSYTYIELNRII